MNDAPLISVITPFLNPGNLLAEAIESVLRQTYIHWEMILVDDGSVKEDSDVALMYSKKFPGKIFYVEHDRHANKGVAISRNAGVSKSHGELIAFLDADDCWLPEKLSRQLHIFKQYAQVQVICEASCFWYSWKDVNAENYIQPIGAAPGVYYPPQLMKILYPLGEKQPPCPSGIVIKREALQYAGGFEERFSGIYQLYEDQAFLSKVYAHNIVYISDEANNMYRKRENSVSSAANDLPLYKKVRLFYLDWLKEYFLNTTPVRPDIEKLINNFEQKLVSS